MVAEYAEFAVREFAVREFAVYRQSVCVYNPQGGARNLIKAL